jgi:hypothetical protein
MDLKPENILLTSIDRPILKVAGRNMMIIYIFQFSSFNQ